MIGCAQPCNLLCCSYYLGHKHNKTNFINPAVAEALRTVFIDYVKGVVKHSKVRGVWGWVWVWG